MKRSVWIENLTGKAKSVRWYENGEKQRFWCPDFATAQRKYVEIKQRLLAQSQGLGDIGANPSEIFERYMTFLSLSHRKGTLRIKRYSIGPFLKSVSRLGDITQNRIRHFRDQSLLKHSPTTVNIELRDLRAFLNWCVKEQYLTSSPFKDIQIPPSKELGRKLELDEVKKILEASELKFKPFLALLVYTGCRVGEALKAQWSDIDVDMWTIPKEHTKTGLQKVVPLPRAVVGLLGEASIGLIFKDFNTFSPRWYFNKALKVAGITGRVRIHDLRHTFASHWDGQPIELMRLMGWKSLAMLSRYTHVGAKALRRAIEEHGIGADLGRNDVTYPKKREI